MSTYTAQCILLIHTAYLEPSFKINLTNHLFGYSTKLLPKVKIKQTASNICSWKLCRQELKAVPNVPKRFLHFGVNLVEHFLSFAIERVRWRDPALNYCCVSCRDHLKFRRTN